MGSSRVPGCAGGSVPALRALPSKTLVFTNSAGAPLRRSAFWTEWNRALRQAGVPAIRFHAPRHYCASLLIRHGESVKTVQARLGHASASETLDTYSHVARQRRAHPGHRRRRPPKFRGLFADQLGCRNTKPQFRGLKVDESADTPGSVPRHRCQ